MVVTDQKFSRGVSPADSVAGNITLEIPRSGLSSVRHSIQYLKQHLQTTFGSSSKFALELPQSVYRLGYIASDKSVSLASQCGNLCVLFSLYISICFFSFFCCCVRLFPPCFAIGVLLHVLGCPLARYFARCSGLLTVQIVEWLQDCTIGSSMVCRKQVGRSLPLGRSDSPFANHRGKATYFESRLQAQEIT